MCTCDGGHPVGGGQVAGGLPAAGPAAGGSAAGQTLGAGRPPVGESPRDVPAALPLLCVTNRLLCSGDFLEQVERVAALRPAGILLREKDLDEAAYARLARAVAAVCRKRGVPLVAHTHGAVARELGCRHLHLTLSALGALSPAKRALLAGEFELSTSCHSVADARRAVELGCARIIAGHVYETGSKPGLPPRGLPFLRDVRAAAGIPVWAIGGVTPGKLPELKAVGASGACMMGYFMRYTC